MAKAKVDRRRLATREDWIRIALGFAREGGVDAIKVVPMAKRLGLTSGSFYWHFKNIHELQAEVLDYWENELTNEILEAARNFEGRATDRILNLMMHVIRKDAATYDHAIAVWANNDPSVQEIYRRTVATRFQFAAWMFEEAGFPGDDARTRGRLMVASLMGEALINLRSASDWESVIRREHALLVSRPT